MAAPGHNQLRSIVSRIERLEEDKQAIADDIREVYTEAKGTGFDVKALRAIVRMRKQDTKKRCEHEAIVETYMAALGMTPLERAIADRDLPPATEPARVTTADRPFGLPDDDLSVEPA